MIEQEKTLNSISNYKVILARVVFAIIFLTLLFYVIKNDTSKKILSYLGIVSWIFLLAIIGYRIFFLSRFEIKIRKKTLIFTNRFFIIRFPKHHVFEIEKMEKVIWSYVGSRAAIMRLTFWSNNNSSKSISFDVSETNLKELFRFFKESKVPFTISGKRKEYYQQLYNEL